MMTPIRDDPDARELEQAIAKLRVKKVSMDRAIAEWESAVRRVDELFEKFEKKNKGSSRPSKNA